METERQALRDAAAAHDFVIYKDTPTRMLFAKPGGRFLELFIVGETITEMLTEYDPTRDPTWAKALAYLEA